MKTRDTSKAEQMYEAIQEWEGSGVSIRNYCYQRGIAYESFRYWKKKFSQEVSRQGFIPISLSGDFSVVPDGGTSGSVITITPTNRSMSHD